MFFLLLAFIHLIMTHLSIWRYSPDRNIISLNYVTDKNKIYNTTQSYDGEPITFIICRSKGPIVIENDSTNDEPFIQVELDCDNSYNTDECIEISEDPLEDMNYFSRPRAR